MREIDDVHDLKDILASAVGCSELQSGLRLDLSNTARQLWPLLATDIATMAVEDAAVCSTIDACVGHITDLCYLRLGVEPDLDIVMGTVAHVVPHLLEPSFPTGHTSIDSCIGHRRLNIVGGKPP